MKKTKSITKEYSCIDLFSGIGGIRIPFEEMGCNFVFSSEIDRFAIKTYNYNFFDLPKGDITLIKEEEIPPFDILLAGFPCQPFSMAGKRRGFGDIRGTLFFDIIRILEYHKPKAILLENVKGLRSHDGGNTLKVILSKLEEAGYKTFSTTLNARRFGVPQNRERIYIVGFKDNASFVFPKGKESVLRLGDILESNVDEKYTISDKLWKGHIRRKKEHKDKGNGFGYSLFNEESPYTSTLSARYYKDGSEILINQNKSNPRKITPKEALRLQGFPDWFKFPVSDTQAYKQCGNSVAVPVIRAIAKNMISSLSSQN